MNEHPLRRLSVVLGLFLGSIVAASCSQSDVVDGHLFVSGVKDFSGETIGLAVDFIPTDSAADLTQVFIQIDARGASFLVEGAGVSAACLRLPASGRLSLASGNGTLNADARVRVTAFRDVTNPSQSQAQAGAASTQGMCTGISIDDALWPTVGASVPPAPAGGGTGGTAGTSGGGSGGAIGMSGAGGQGGTAEGGGGTGGGAGETGASGEPNGAGAAAVSGAGGSL